MTPWQIEERELINCNCSYGCPCQFNALPSQGFLPGDGGHRHRPGSLRRAAPRRAEARGENVFATTVDKVFDPIVTDIQFDVDIDARRGTVRAEGVLELQGEPIRNPVTGLEHRARINLPRGFEYEVAEIGSASSRSRGNIAIELKDSYAQFARLHLNNKGPVRQRAAA